MQVQTSHSRRQPWKPHRASRWPVEDALMCVRNLPQEDEFYESEPESRSPTKQHKISNYKQIRLKRVSLKIDLKATQPRKKVLH